jgi:hypothetical protein
VAQYREIGDYCDEIFRDLITFLTAARNTPGDHRLGVFVYQERTSCHNLPGIRHLLENEKFESIALFQPEVDCAEGLWRRSRLGPHREKVVMGDKEIIANYGIDRYFRGKGVQLYGKSEAGHLPNPQRSRLAGSADFLLPGHRLTMRACSLRPCRSWAHRM